MEEKKKENVLYKKWWFWLILLAMTIVLGFVAIIIVALNITLSGINEVALDIQNIDNEATVYTSAGGNTIIVEIPNYSDNTKREKVKRIEEKIKSYATKDVLANYSKVLICSKINSDDEKKDYMLSTNAYSLPDMIPDLENSSIYVDFIEQTKNSLSTTKSSATETKGEDITLSAGKYIIGTDIKAGKYDVIAQSGSGNFFVSGSTRVNEILTTNIKQKQDYGWIDKYNNLILKDGDTVELKNGLTILLQAK